MVAIAKSGIHFTDPREFLRLRAAPTNLAIYDSAASASTAAVVGFFTNMAVVGLADDTNWTADTYKTILSISSGMGLVSNIVGPTGLAGTPTTTFEITVDGVLYTFAIVASAITQRAILGPIMGDSTAGAFFTTAKIAQTLEVSNAAAKTDLLTAGSMMPWRTIRAMGMPCLKFSQSLLIRMKSSESNSTTGNVERQSAVQYMVMA